MAADKLPSGMPNIFAGLALVQYVILAMMLIGLLFIVIGTYVAMTKLMKYDEWR